MKSWTWKAALVLAMAVAAWTLLGGPAPLPVAGFAGARADSTNALALADSICGCEGQPLNPDCRTRVIPADRPDGREGPARARAPVIVLFHGFTNCPKQFDRLGHDLARRGYTVVIPLLPRHGMADRMTTELRRFNAEELVRAGDRALDVAHGLGGPITVVGLSSSAVLTAWLAQRRDVDEAVVIAPAFGPRGMPYAAVRPLTNALLAIPNFYVWWDSKLRDKVPGPRQCYPRFSSRAIAQVYRLGADVLRDARREKPRARRLVIVTAAGDEAVNNEVGAELARLWRARGARVETYQFPAGSGVRHDMIDPEQPYQRTAQVYPVLERLIAPPRG